jgi:DNA ligase-1
VRRANMLLGDIGETLRMAAGNCLDQARMRLFHPIGFMLANEVKSSAEAIASFAETQTGAEIDAQIEDKYDGIRAQVHCGEGQVRIFSRTQDEIGGSFPELIPVFASRKNAVVIDGEILAWNPSASLSDGTEMGSQGAALPFSALQKRLGRKRVNANMLEEIPVIYVAFDVLYARGELLIDLPLRERGPILDEIIAELAANARSSAWAGVEQTALAFDSGNETAAFPRIIRAPAFRAHTAAQIDSLFDQARARGNEGLMLKNLASSYLPGLRGGAWLKMKRELATLDVVVTAVEYGHGKRAGVLSD